MATIAVDFDHTLVHGDKPIEGAREAINILREQGHYIIIHSCNNPEWIERVMNNNNMRFDHIWTSPGKPVADIYVDDLGYRFENWSLETIMAIVSHVGARA